MAGGRRALASALWVALVLALLVPHRSAVASGDAHAGSGGSSTAAASEVGVDAQGEARVQEGSGETRVDPPQWRQLRELGFAATDPRERLCTRYRELALFTGSTRGPTAMADWPVHASATLNDVGMSWARMGEPRKGLDELHSMMIWASMLNHEQYAIAPIPAMLSNLADVGRTVRDAHPMSAYPDWPPSPSVAECAKLCNRTRRGYTIPAADLAQCDCSQRLQESTVAVVTLCSYDPLVTPLSGLCADNKLRYTMRHGYEFFFEGKPRVADRPIAWSKLKAVEEHMGRADWMMWTDCDTLFTNFNRGVERLLPDDPNIHLVVSEDALMVNTGVFLLRNHEWSRRLLEAWWGPDDARRVGDTLWEQAALQMLLVRARRLQHAREGTCAPHLEHVLDGDDDHVKAADALDVLAHTLIVPQGWMNPYPRATAVGIRTLDDEPAHAVAGPDSLVVSLSGCKMMHGQEKCNDLLDRAYEHTADEPWYTPGGPDDPRGREDELWAELEDTFVEAVEGDNTVSM